MPIVFERNGEVFATSRDGAAYFEKEVRHVHEAIRNLISQEPSLGLASFRPFKINDLTGETVSYYDMNRDGFTLLCMGFTGPKALRFKMRYIDAFNKMEAALKKAAPPIDLNDPATLRGLLASYADKALELQKEVDELRPSQAALERISTADGSLCITDAAKALQMQPKEFFARLQRNGWIFKRRGSSTYLGYESKVLAGYLEHKVTAVPRGDGSEKMVEQVRITPKGLTKIASLISRH
jgi:Rha family phage regulatory protein